MVYLHILRFLSNTTFYLPSCSVRNNNHLLRQKTYLSANAEMVLFTLVLVSLMASRNAELRRWRHSNQIILGELNLLENPLLMGTELQSNTTLQAIPPCKQYHLASNTTLQAIPPWKQYHLGSNTTLEAIPPWKQYHLASNTTLQAIPPCKQYHLGSNTTLQAIPPWKQYHLGSNTTLEAAGWSSSSEKEPTDTGNSSEQETNPCEADGDISPISSASDYHEPSDCDIEHDEPLPIIPISSVLASWATTQRVSQKAVYSLLHILRTYGCNVPQDTRTLLKTPRSVATDSRCSGSYIYLGVEQGIKCILNSNIYTGTTIRLIINIDGLPLYKSSSVGVWPILARFGDLHPLVVAIYCGEGKPTNVNDYLKDFCEEADSLKQNGLQHAHTGYFACERCQVEGEFGGRLVFHNRC